PAGAPDSPPSVCFTMQCRASPGPTLRPDSVAERNFMLRVILRPLVSLTCGLGLCALLLWSGVVNAKQGAGRPGGMPVGQGGMTQMVGGIQGGIGGIQGGIGGFAGIQGGIGGIGGSGIGGVGNIGGIAGFSG